MQRPLLPLLGACCAGLLTAHCCELPAAVMTVCLGTAVFAMGGAWLARCPRVAAVAALAALYCAGWALLQPFLRLPPPQHVVHWCDRPGVHLEGVVAAPPVVRRGRLRLDLRVESVHTRQCAHAACGLVRLTIRVPRARYRYGDRLRLACTLRRPHNFNNPGCFDYVRYLAWRNVRVVAYLPDDCGFVVLGRASTSRLRAVIEHWREAIRERIERSVQGPAAGVLRAFVLGDRDAVPEQVRERFAALGVSHLLAISGLHAGIVAWFCATLLLRLLKCSRRVLLYLDARKLALGGALVPVALYCCIAGLQVPALRACLMIAVYILTVVAGRRQDLLDTLLLAAAVILVVMPPALFDVSFQLSFTAVLSLIVVLPPLQERLLPNAPQKPFPPEGVLLRAGRWLVGAVLVSIAAFAGTAPIAAAAFHRVAVSGWVANLVLVPLAGMLIIPLCLAATALLPFSAHLSGWLFAAAGLCTGEMLLLVDGWTRMGLARVVRWAPASWEAAACVAALLCGAHLLRTKKRLPWALAMVLLLSVVVAEQLQGPPRDRMQAVFLDVGQGDAAVVRLPGGEVMLIDGGGFRDPSADMGEAVIGPVLDRMGVRRVDYIVLSHPHQDHIGGLAYVMAHFRVGEFWFGSAAESTPALQHLCDLAARSGVVVRRLRAGSGPRAIGPVTVDVVNPRSDEVLPARPVSAQSNNASLVLRLAYGDFSLLFTGDIMGDREDELAAAGALQPSTVLKVPHHGRRGSSSPALIAAVRPRVAIVSCGSRQGARALRETCCRYRAAGADVYCTDQCGAVTVTSEGVSFRVELFLGCAAGYRQ